MYSPYKNTKLHPRQIADIFLLGMIIYCFYLSYNHPINVTETLQNWSLAHIVLHSLPVYFYLKNLYWQKTNFPFIETMAAFNILHYGLPAFFIKTLDFQLGTLSADSLEVSFYAYTLFYIVYYFSRNKWYIKPVEFIPSHTSVLRLKFYAYILLAGYFIGKITGDPTLQQLGTVIIYIYVGFMINLWRDKQLNLFEKILFITILFYDILNRAVGGLISPLALMIFFISLSIVLSKSRRIFILIGLALFVWFYSIFSGVKSTFREKVWFESNDYSLMDKIALIGDLTAESKKEKSVVYVDKYQGKDQFLWRYSYQLSALSMVMKKTPSIVPFWEGDTYLPLFSKFIPRIIWADKPEENMGYKFGVAYRVISASNKRTSINTPVLPELYINYGFSGVYIGSIILGLLYSILASLFNSNRVSYSSKIIGMAIIFPLVIWESNFSLIFGNLLLMTFILILLYRLMVSVFNIR